MFANDFSKDDIAWASIKHSFYAGKETPTSVNTRTWFIDNDEQVCPLDVGIRRETN